MNYMDYYPDGYREELDAPLGVICPVCGNTELFGDLSKVWYRCCVCRSEMVDMTEDELEAEIEARKNDLEDD